MVLNRSRIGILAAIGLSFALGFASIFLSRQSGTPPEPPPPLEAEQIDILILGVDDLGKNPSNIRAIWWVSYRPPGNSLFLFGLPIDSVNSQVELNLQSPNGGTIDLEAIAPEFFGELALLVPIQFNTVIILDEIGFAAVVDLLGGVSINNNIVEGGEMTAFLGLLTDNPLALVETQARILEELSVRSSEAGLIQDLTSLQNLIPEHIYISTQTSEFVALISPLMPWNSILLHIEFLQ